MQKRQKLSQNGILFTSGSLHVAIYDSTQYANVFYFEADGLKKIAGTMTRARVFSGDKFEWSISDREGNVIHSANRVFECLNAMRKTMRAANVS